MSAEPRPKVLDLVQALEDSLVAARAVAAEREHLRVHITDGRWHDDCAWCRERRIHGGTGVRAPITPTPSTGANVSTSR